MTKNEASTVLVTGASSGIGQATALHLARKGYSIVGTSRSIDRLEGLQRRASETGLSLAAVELDINSGSDVARVLPELIDAHGPIDALVNNAGYGLWGPLEAYSVEDLRSQFETNLFAVVGLIKEVLPGMMSRRRGTIVNVTSVAGRLAMPFHSAYSSSKFALEGLSESLRNEMRPFGVRVALVEPGAVRTSFQSNQVVAPGLEAVGDTYQPYIDTYRRRHSRFERRGADPESVAKVVHKVIRSRNPALRHPVGIDARLGMLGARLLPERLVHALVARITMGGSRQPARPSGQERTR